MQQGRTGKMKYRKQTNNLHAAQTSVLKVQKSLCESDLCCSDDLQCSSTNQHWQSQAEVGVSQSRTGLGSRQEYVAYMSLGSIITM
jgi:hypothetical protein